MWPFVYPCYNSCSSRFVRIYNTSSPVGAKVFIFTVILKSAPVVHGKVPQSPQEPIHSVVGRSCYDRDMQLTRKRTVCNVYIPSIYRTFYYPLALAGGSLRHFVPNVKHGINLMAR